MQPSSSLIDPITLVVHNQVQAAALLGKHVSLIGLGIKTMCLFTFMYEHVLVHELNIQLYFNTKKGL